jgi:peroxiredoxin-like protein
MKEDPSFEGLLSYKTISISSNFSEFNKAKERIQKLLKEVFILKSNVNIVWKSGLKGNGFLETEFLDTKIAIPAEFGGSGNGASPKEILVASAAACYTSVLVSMIESRYLPVVDLTVNSEEINSDDEFKIIHYPHIVLSGKATEKQIQAANRIFSLADKGCTVGNLLKKAGIKIEIQGNISSTN